MNRASVYMRTKRGKYGNTRCEADGYTFASMRERNRYFELKMLQKAGEISNLRLQPRYDLHAWTPDGKKKVAVYIGDFEFVENGKFVTEDSKGVRTPLYRMKKRWMLAEYGIEIRET